jgi:hypothetical protein
MTSISSLRSLSAFSTHKVCVCVVCVCVCVCVCVLCVCLFVCLFVLRVSTRRLCLNLWLTVRAVVDFDILTEDYSKVVLLTDDRNVEVHARYGFHYRVRQ